MLVVVFYGIQTEKGADENQAQRVKSVFCVLPQSRTAYLMHRVTSVKLMRHQAKSLWLFLQGQSNRANTEGGHT